MHHKNKAVEYAKIFFQKWGNSMRDYDKEPIVIKNDYLLKSRLTVAIFFLIFALVFAIRSIFPIESFFSSILRKGELALCIFIFFKTIFGDFAMLKGMLVNDLQIRIFEKIIECDYVDFAGNFKVLKIQLTEHTKITYSYFPCFGETAKLDSKTLMDKITYITNLAMAIVIIFIIIFQCLNFLGIKKYYIFDDNGTMISVKQNKLLVDRFGKVPFNKRTLMISLINYNSKFFDKDKK